MLDFDILDENRLYVIAFNKLFWYENNKVSQCIDILRLYVQFNIFRNVWCTKPVIGFLPVFSDFACILMYDLDKTNLYFLMTVVIKNNHIDTGYYLRDI